MCCQDNDSQVYLQNTERLNISYPRRDRILNDDMNYCYNYYPDHISALDQQLDLISFFNHDQDVLHKIRYLNETRVS